MAKGDETPRTNPAEIESLIEQIRGTNLEPGAKEKVERLLRTVLTLVELLGRRNISIKKLRQNTARETKRRFTSNSDTTAITLRTIRYRKISHGCRRRPKKRARGD